MEKMTRTEARNIIQDVLDRMDKDSFCINDNSPLHNAMLVCVESLSDGEWAKDYAIVWHPYPQENPPEIGEYLVTIDYENVDGCYVGTLLFDGDFWGNYSDGVTAWAKLPTPYNNILLKENTDV